MRIEGTFLGSAAARRVFWTLLAAATVPLLLFGALGYGTLAEHLDRQAQRANAALLKQIGLRVFDHLSAARAALAAHARAESWSTPAITDPSASAVLRAVATLPDNGGPAAGDATLAADWRHAVAQTADATPAAGRRVLWWAPASPGRAARVIIGHRDVAGRGWWLGEVDPAFLWADFNDDGTAGSICVADTMGRPLRCDSPRDTGASTRWSLFLDGGFGSPDWSFTGAPSAGTDELSAIPLARWGALGAGATVALISVLSLVLVRRSLVPLEELIAGTRRLTGRDWAARVPVGRRDEFGELAVSFNTMAEQVGRQMQAMEVQATIDRAILDGRDTDGVMRRVAQRLQALVPRACVAVVARDADGVRWRAHLASGAVPGVLAVDACVLTAPGDGLAWHQGCTQPAPPWALAALGLTPADGDGVYWVPAIWHGEVVALLLVGATDGPLFLDEDTQREVTDLRDRVAVALAAAAREHLLLQRAVRDGLTGLFNRSGLQEACDRWLPAVGPVRPFSMIFIDLDAFKEVNDSFGHQTGDELLVLVARRLGGCVPPHALLARPGGDEFVVLLPGSRDDACALAAALCRSLAEPFSLRRQQIHIGASIGIACCPEHAGERTELMRRADVAMYAAKAEGRGRWRMYGAELDERAAEKAWIVRDLRHALESGGLHLHFQPRVDVHSLRANSAEALVRWTHPQRGPVGPQHFIPFAEEAGLIEALGAWVLDAALRQLKAWRVSGVELGRVAVNVSPRQLRDPDFAGAVFEALARHGLQATDLELEITESLFVGDVDAVCSRLAPLHDRGVLIALDDFGTGYSSLSVLHKLPIDVLKIDRSFVVDLGQRVSADAMARSIVAMARALGKRTVAEGVETPMHEEYVRALGCDEIQGYLYARPLAPDAFAERLRQGFGTAPQPRPVPA